MDVSLGGRYAHAVSSADKTVVDAELRVLAAVLGVADGTSLVLEGVEYSGELGITGLLGEPVDVLHHDGVVVDCEVWLSHLDVDLRVFVGRGGYITRQHISHVVLLAGHVRDLVVEALKLQHESSEWLFWVAVRLEVVERLVIDEDLEFSAVDIVSKVANGPDHGECFLFCGLVVLLGY